MLGRITTTEAKAKELRPYAEGLLTRAKKSDLTARRALARLFLHPVVKKISENAVAREKGGYTRIIRAGVRKSDGAKMAIIELVK